MREQVRLCPRIILGFIRFTFEQDKEKRFKRRGGVWKYFIADSNKRARCNLCSGLISFKGGSTTNLLRHMKSKHPSFNVPNRIYDSNSSLKLSSSSMSSKSTPSLQHSFAEIVSECVKSDDENDFQIIHHVQFDGDNDMSDGIENITTLSSIDPSFSQNLGDQVMSFL